MLKSYKAKSHVSLSVPMSSGKSVHVVFSALTGGGSVFYTSDEELQRALEGHHKFGKLFKEAALPEEPAPKPIPKVSESEAAEESKILQVEVPSVDDAKEYLVERYGISRTKLRTVKAIKDAAESKGIEFVGI